MWFVQRTPYDFVIQQRKPFKVMEPKCTYDYVNSRYFPYAMLDDDGNPVTQSDAGFDGIPDVVDYVDEEVFYGKDGERRRRTAEAKSKKEEAAKKKPKVTKIKRDAKKMKV